MFVYDPKLALKMMKNDAKGLALDDLLFGTSYCCASVSLIKK